MRKEIVVNLPIKPNEVPALRELVGWEGRHSDYPILFERCNFWAGLRDDQEDLIAFGYISIQILLRRALEKRMMLLMGGDIFYLSVIVLICIK